MLLGQPLLSLGLFAQKFFRRFARASTTKAAIKRNTPSGKEGTNTAKDFTNWKRRPRANRITEIKKASLVGALSFIFLLIKQWLFKPNYDDLILTRFIRDSIKMCTTLGQFHGSDCFEVRFLALVKIKGGRFMCVSLTRLILDLNFRGCHHAFGTASLYI